MAVPKKRKSKSKTRTRRSHNMRLTMPGFQECPSCGAMKQSHRACGSCGTYKNEQVLEVIEY
ncbi:50S ribosomal protein L32 [Microvenator marinus]|jgi:large subunit ribosomal protein L32|uniref:Large ribosomal subunit protein bL32 n=1 Tax=Microvenator marinus TaxID=2600177 RepID=A0A5B8XVK4_9DELT|nr:50S ribosomal protein L32 [Microvenator marinus]QED29615.1 50S ribosomal protein L32 [Microvenator marinus]